MSIKIMSNETTAGKITKPASKKIYIANCIWNIQTANCHASRERKRDEDIAEAILIAAESGVDHAHDYLVNLAKNANGGKYSIAV